MIIRNKILLIALLFGAMPAATQNLQKLRLQDAVGQALQNKAALKSLDVEAQIAAARVAETRLKKQTQISGKADVQLNPLLPASVIPVGAFNPSLPSDATATVRFGTLWQNAVGLNASQTLYDPSISAQIREQELQTRIVEARRAETAAEVRDAVARAYYAVLIGEAEQEFAVQDSLRAAAFFNEVNARQSEGRASRIDQNQARISLNAAALRLARLRLNQEQLRRVLLYEMGLPAERLPELTPGDDLENLLRETSRTDAGFSAEAVAQNRPEIRQLQLDNNLQDLKMATEKTRTAPKISANAYLGVNNFSDEAPFFTKNSWYGTGFLSLNLSAPISEYWQLKKHLPQYRLKQEQNALKTEELTQQYRNDYENARAGFRSAAAALESSKNDLSLARENVELYKARFSEGAALSTAVTDAETTLRQFQYNYLKSAYDLLTAKLEMNRAKGE